MLTLNLKCFKKNKLFMFSNFCPYSCTKTASFLCFHLPQIESHPIAIYRNASAQNHMFVHLVRSYSTAFPFICGTTVHYRKWITCSSIHTSIQCKFDLRKKTSFRTSRRVGTLLKTRSHGPGDRWNWKEQSLLSIKRTGFLSFFC